jgi:restriction endonuclease S subunit
LLDGLAHGGSTKTRITPEAFEQLQIPLPPLTTQRAIVSRWSAMQEEVTTTEALLPKVVDSLNDVLQSHYRANTKEDIFNSRWLAPLWSSLSRWDLKSARASILRKANQSFRPLGEFAEEVVDPVKPWEQPDKNWSVYGVNNTEGVFFSHYQKGKKFRPGYFYKRIQKDWFFHNPTRSSVGSLGIVPDVAEDAITSPEYQVWRVKQGMLPGYVALLINTRFFIDLIQIHRVGAVKQRLYAENLLEICVPVLPNVEQQHFAQAREIALEQIAHARRKAQQTKTEIEAMILGTKSINWKQNETKRPLLDVRRAI